MVLSNLVSGLWNWLYLKNEQMDLTDFLHVDTDPQKLKAEQKFIGWTWSKMCVASLVTGLYLESCE